MCSPYYQHCKYKLFICSAFTYEVYSGGGPSTYVYCVITTPYVRSIGRVFANIYTLVDDLERPWTMSFPYYPG